MMLRFDGEKPIFLQLAEHLEDGIISGAYPEEEQIPSITEFSTVYKINPATALKGINILVDEGLIYKKRGIGMFVAEGARAQLLRKRGEAFYEASALPTIKEAKRLGISLEELQAMIKRGYENGD